MNRNSLKMERIFIRNHHHQQRSYKTEKYWCSCDLKFFNANEDIGIKTREKTGILLSSLLFIFSLNVQATVRNTSSKYNYWKKKISL